MPALQDLTALCRAEIGRRPECEDFAPVFAGPADPAAQAPGRLLAGRDASRTAAHLGETAPLATAETAPLVSALIAADPPWRCGYVDGAPTGVGYHELTAATVLAGPGAPLPGGTAATPGRAGFFFVRRGVRYAPHAHRPREIYALVAGRARFWSEAGWRAAAAGETVATPSRAWHGMATPDSPALILWAWIGEELDERPVFLSDTGRFPDDA